MLESTGDELGDRVTMMPVEEAVTTVKNTTNANNCGNELLDANGDAHEAIQVEKEDAHEAIQVENKDEKGCGDGNGDGATCAIEEGSSDVKEETKKDEHSEVAVEESSAAKTEDNKESSTLPPEDTAKDAAFQQEAQPGYYKRMPSNQPEQPHQVPVRPMMPSQQARVSLPPMQHQSIQINQAMQHQHLLPLNHPAQFQPLPFRQPIQHQQLPPNQQIEHQQSLRQGLQEASYQGEYQIPQFIHCEPEIRSEPVLGKRALPSRSGGPLGRDAAEHLPQEVLDAAAAMALADPVYDSYNPMKTEMAPMKNAMGYAHMQPMKSTQNMHGSQYHNQYASQMYGQPHIGEVRDANVPLNALPQDNILQLCQNCQKEGITTYKLPRRWCSQCRTRKRAKQSEQN